MKAKNIKKDINTLCHVAKIIFKNKILKRVRIIIYILYKYKYIYPHQN